MSKLWKLSPIMTAAVAVALLLAGVLLAAYNERAYKAQKIDEVTVQAQILASTVTAALAFNDRAAAQEYVNALAINPEVQAAALYDANGSLFVSYARAAESVPPAALPGGETRLVGDRLMVSASVTQGTEALGTAYLRTITEPLARRLERYAAFGLLLTMASLVVAVLGGAQAALTKANRQLQSRASELDAANRSLQAEMTEREKAEEALRQAQKMEAVGQLTSGIAHDFNNLLASVLGNLELIEARLGAAADPAVARMLANARRSGERGAKLTRDLLAFARKQNLRVAPIDLNAVVRGGDDLLQRTVGPLVRIEHALGSDLWPALADGSQMELVILNLAINARDAMPSGGTITVETANIAADDPRRPKDLPPGGEYVMVAASDTGTGMTQEVLEKCMEPFYTTKDVGKGSGLGLSMVLGVAKQSGGTVEIETELGHGTSVRVYLPRARADGAARRPAGSGAAAESGPLGARVLLVDDDLDVRDVAAAQLTALGCIVTEAPSGRAALELIEQHGPQAFDLLISDYAMPGMTGADLAREARARRPDLPVLMITGYADAKASSPDIEDDWGWLPKPFRQADLADRVRQALGRSPSGSDSNVIPLKPSKGG